jgi:hypothetical protein
MIRVTKKYNYTKKTGRPTKYKPEYCQEIIKYFSIKHYVKVGKKQVANPIPLLKTFAVRIGVTFETLAEWCREHKEFSVAYTVAKHLQEDMLISNTLKGLYDSRFAIFAAKNMIGWVDRTEVDHGIADDTWNKYKEMSIDQIDKELQELISDSRKNTRALPAPASSPADQSA